MRESTVLRGRVLFSKTDSTIIVYMDEALLNKRTKKLVADFFHLHEVKVSWRKDLHYTTNRKAIDKLLC